AAFARQAAAPDHGARDGRDEGCPHAHACEPSAEHRAGRRGQGGAAGGAAQHHLRHQVSPPAERSPRSSGPFTPPRGGAFSCAVRLAFLRAAWYDTVAPVLRGEKVFAGGARTRGARTTYDEAAMPTC